MRTIEEYRKFLETKKTTIPESGFDVGDSDMNPHLFPFQRHCVRRALKCGKYALFENTGLGKTIQQLEWGGQIVRHTGGKVIIIAPLAVVGQTIDEGRKFGYKVARVGEPGEGIYITNYDQIPNIEASDYVGVVLDESSILKNFDGATSSLSSTLSRRHPTSSPVRPRRAPTM